MTSRPRFLPKSQTPARHAMGRHIIEKTGNVAAVPRQLGHKNAAYSLQYTRITDEELRTVMDDRYLNESEEAEPVPEFEFDQTVSR